MENQTKKLSVSKTTRRVTANNPFAKTGAGVKKTASASSKSSSKKSSSSKSSNKTPTAIARVAQAAGVAGAAAVAARATKAVRKSGGKTFITAIICFVLDVIIGAGVCFFAGRNDYFELVGADTVFLEIGEKYTDEGVSIREFGLDLSGRANIDTDLKTDADGKFYADEMGDYYIAYTVKSLKFGLIYPVTKIRLISVTGESEGGL